MPVHSKEFEAWYHSFLDKYGEWSGSLDSDVPTLEELSEKGRTNEV